MRSTGSVYKVDNGKRIPTPMERWAWEFLRRRSDYRDRWNQLVRPFLDDPEAIERHYLEVTRKAMQQGLPVSLDPPSALIGNLLRDEFKVFGCIFFNRFVDPRLAEPPRFEGLNSTKVVKLQPEFVQWPKMLIEFDVTLPIEPQLKRAGDVLRRRAAKDPKAPRAVSA
jgi:hypothetical protein